MTHAGSRAVAVSLAIALSACTVPVPRPALPDLGLTRDDRFTDAPGRADGAGAGGRSAPAAPSWWRHFDDPALGTWVERALAASPDIEIARERLVQAQALFRQAGAARWPQVTAVVSTETETGSTLGSRAAGAQPRGRLEADWTLDLWGARRQAERSAAAEVLRRVDLVRAARLGVAATTARAVIEWREAQADLSLLTAAERVQREALSVVLARVDAGLAPRLDADRARAEIAAVAAERAGAAIRRRLAHNALRVLAGEPPFAARQPSDAGVGRGRGAGALAEGADTARGRESRMLSALDENAVAVPGLAGDAPDLLPVDLLRMRPDLRAAEQAVIGAAADVGVARAELLPTLSLQGVLALSSGASVFDRVNAAIAAVLEGVLFDGGARRAGVSAAESRLREALQVYRRTLLEALGQVEDALATGAGIVTRIDRLSESLVAADAALEQSRSLYAAGLVGYIDVLEARRTALRQRREMVGARADAARQDVAAFEAMGILPEESAAPAMVPGVHDTAASGRVSERVPRP